jgi:hypothetical protein
MTGVLIQILLCSPAGSIRSAATKSSPGVVHNATISLVKKICFRERMTGVLALELLRDGVLELLRDGMHATPSLLVQAKKRGWLDVVEACHQSLARDQLVRTKPLGPREQKRDAKN